MFEYGCIFLLCFIVVFIAGVATGDPLRVSYDDDGMVTVNGERTLIIGSYYAAKSDAPYAELAEAGFNLVRTGNDPAKMDQAHSAGLWTWCSVGTLDLDNRQASAEKLLEAVNSVKDHPALLFIETVDEPAWKWMEAVQRVPAEAFAEAYPLIKEADPNHLLYINHAPTNLVKTMRPYNAGTDVVAMDIYPVNPGGLKHMYALFADGRQGDLNNEHISQVGEYVDKMRRVTGPDRPLMMVLQGFAWEMLVDETIRRQEKILFPTYAQSRFMAFQSLIKGANGIIYWGTHTTPQPSQTWSDLKRVVREVADLAQPLAERAADVDLEIDYHEMGHSVDTGVQVLVKDWAGDRYVFTCNADKNICKATLSGLGDWRLCSVLYEADRDVSIEKDALTDVWLRFDVHVYKLSR